MDDLSMYAINNDLYDRNHFGNIRSDADEIRRIEKQYKDKCEHIEFLSQDFYSALYKARPSKTEFPSQDIDLHSYIIDLLFANEKYNELRKYTYLDEFASAISLPPIMKEIIDSLPENNEGEGKGEGGEGESDNNEEGGGESEEENNELKNLISSAIEKSCEKAIEEVSEIGEYMDGWGTDKGQIQKLPFKEKMSLRDRLMRSSKMKVIAKMVGRASRLAISAQKTKLTCEPEEACDIELGNNLNRILPNEIILLHGSKNTEDEFYRKYCEEMLMQYDLRSITKEEKGPIVCAIDNSGSMMGTSEIWSKAFGLGLLEIAIKQNRKLAIIHFGSKGEYSRFDFSDGNAPISKKIKCAEHFFGGGTDFVTPMNICLDIIESEMPKADIVFITDGQCDVPSGMLEKWHKKKESMGVSCYGIFINQYGYPIPNIMEEICDSVINARDILRAGDEYQRKIYESI